MKARKHFALGFIPALLLAALPAAAQQTYAIRGAKIYTPWRARRSKTAR